MYAVQHPAIQVLRRPHEFKIRCLEDIRALFPSDWNPFYAGFGNRDTDEISYLTVGVPASKCFIINPKGVCLYQQHWVALLQATIAYTHGHALWLSRFLLGVYMRMNLCNSVRWQHGEKNSRQASTKAEHTLCIAVWWCHALVRLSVLQAS